jgi:hypothetical protein
MHPILRSGIVSVVYLLNSSIVASNKFSPDEVDESTPRKITLCMVDKVQNAGLKSGTADDLKKFKKMGVKLRPIYI